jgi:hypothetical protein
MSDPLLIPVPMPRSGEEIQPLQGVRAWKNKQNQFTVVRVHYEADPAKRGDWKHRVSPSYGGLQSWRWLKEHEIDWQAMSGRLIFGQLDVSIHEIQPFPIPEHWPRWVCWDPGWSNPNSVLWIAVDTDTEPTLEGYRPLHIYREFYESKRTSEEVARVIFFSCGGDSLDGVAPTEPIEEIIVDPGARQEHQSAGKAAQGHVSAEAETVLDKFTEEIERLGWDVPVRTGTNAKTEAILELIGRVGNYWTRLDGVALFDENNAYRNPTEDELLEGAFLIPPTLYVHQNCPHTFRELRAYRWQDWSAQEVRDRRNEPEKPVDKDDHSITNLIRFVNHLAGTRGKSDGEKRDLYRFGSRHDRRVVKTAAEVAEDEHESRAGKFRSRYRR